MKGAIRSLASALALVVGAGVSLAGPADEPLTLAYDASADQLSLRARAVPLDRVLQEVAAASSLTIELRDRVGLREDAVELTLEAESLEHALSRLLEGYSWVAFRDAGDDVGGPAHRLGKVIVLSRRAEPPLPNDRPRVEGADLVEALIEEPDILETTKAAGPAEVRRAVEALSSALDGEKLPVLEQASEMIRALNELAPERALGILLTWLDSEDPRPRRRAAAGLSLVGDDASVTLLLLELRDQSDPLTRQIAANSLAEIGTPQAIAALFDAYFFGTDFGDPALARVALTAIARNGDPAVQSEMAELLSFQPVPEGRSARDVIIEHLPAEEVEATIRRRRTRD